MRQKLLAIPFGLPFVHKSALPKTAVDDAPGSSLLGLTTTVGAPLLGNAASNNQKTDVAGWMQAIPDDFQEGSAYVILRVRAKIATAVSVASNTYNKVDATAALEGDGSMGSDLVTTSAQQVTIAYADYDFRIPATTLRRGSILRGTVTCDNQDTGGSNNKAMSISKLSLVYPSRS